MAGRRLAQVDHGMSGADTTTRYTYPVGADQPHTLSSTTTATSTAASPERYSYDAAGNTILRPGTAGTQTLHLGSPRVTLPPPRDDVRGHGVHLRCRRQPAHPPRRHRQDAVPARTPNCATPPRTGKAKPAPGTTASAGDRGGAAHPAGVTWLLGDHHGTQQIAIDERPSRSPAAGRRRSAPPRRQGDLAERAGFVGGTADPTGTDPPRGPRIRPGYRPVRLRVTRSSTSSDPQQLQGYAYANNSPITSSDPTGMLSEDETSHGTWHDWSSETTPEQSTGGTNASTGGNGGNSDKSRKCGTWDIGCKTKKAVAAGLNWADEHKAAIAGFVVGMAVGIGCEAAVGWTGVGAVACGALAGSIGEMVTYAIETKVEHKGEFSVGGLLAKGAVGAVIGAAFGGLGAIGGQGLKAGRAGLLAGSGARASGRQAAKAMAAEARNIATGARGAIGKGVSAIGKALKKGCSSFAAGTPILLADGTTKAIEAVTIGDKVIATDPETGTTEPEPVVATITSTGEKHLVGITLDTDGPTGQATGTLTATDTHPFWVADLNQWVNATDLQVGQWLRTSTGTWVQITALLHWTVPNQQVFNLTIANTPTYHVIAGNQPVLVHNCPMSRDPKVLGKVKLPRALQDLDIPHIREGHVPGGAKVAPGKGLWPADVTGETLRDTASALLRNSPRIVGYDATQRMIQLRARVAGKLYEMIINRDTGIGRSVYPK